MPRDESTHGRACTCPRGRLHAPASAGAYMRLPVRAPAYKGLLRHLSRFRNYFGTLAGSEITSAPGHLGTWAPGRIDLDNMRPSVPCVAGRVSKKPRQVSPARHGLLQHLSRFRNFPGPGLLQHLSRFRNFPGPGLLQHLSRFILLGGSRRFIKRLPQRFQSFFGLVVN